jgi:hypothetical protein
MPSPAILTLTWINAAARRLRQLDTAAGPVRVNSTEASAEVTPAA